METEVLIAILASTFSLIVAIVSIIGERRNARVLEEFRAKLTEAQSERDARRDYEYEARKRLYQEFEPLLFQFLEFSENASDRIAGLARTARNGNLNPHSSWLAGDSYYLRSTIYRLMAPLVVAKLMQRRLTLVDLRVDPRIRGQYSLIKVLYNSLNDAFAIAAQIPKLEYDPNSEVSDEQHRKEAPRYYPQGMYSMYLDTVVNAMVQHSENDPPRCMSYEEFEDIYKNKASSAQQSFEQIRTLFWGFHPKDRPVLWRTLLVQAQVYRALRNLTSRSEPSLNIRELSTPAQERLVFDWRDHNSQASDQEVLVDPFTAAESYMRDRLASILPPDGKM